jgi:nicotinamidase-related amidase
METVGGCFSKHLILRSVVFSYIDCVTRDRVIPPIMTSPFWRPIDMGRTALLLSDVQTQLVAHMPEYQRTPYFAAVLGVLQHFQSQILHRRADVPSNPLAPNDGIPLIIHHVVASGANSNSFVSPYHKLNTWALRRTQTSGVEPPPTATDLNTPVYAIPDAIKPSNGWNVDEVLIGKIAPGSFANSDVLTYLRARDIRHVVILGLTTEESVLSSVRGASDLDFHALVPKDACWADEEEVHRFVLKKLVDRFADVISVADIEGLD